MNFSRIFRVVVCLVLCVCMVFNFGSVEADALAVSTTIGLIAALIAASCGVTSSLYVFDF